MLELRSQFILITIRNLNVDKITFFIQRININMIIHILFKLNSSRK